MLAVKLLLHLIARFAFSYVGLVVFPLLIIVASMNVVAAYQTNRQLFQFMRFDTATFAGESRADYAPAADAYSAVVRFEGAGSSLRDAVTSLSSGISAVSARIVEEARREDAARAALPTGASFGLSADTARAVAAPVLGSDALRALTTIGSTPTAPPAAASTGVSVFGFATAGAASPTATGSAPAPVAAVQTPFPPVTPPPAVAPPPGAGGTSGTSQPAAPSATPIEFSSAALPFSPPAPDTPATAPPAAPPPPPAATAPSVLAASPSPPPIVVPASPTPPPTIVPLFTATASAPTPTLALPTASPTAQPEEIVAEAATATATPLPTATVVPTATVPPLAMDLSVPGGTSSTFQPIFSGTLELVAGESVSRSISVQNNGTRAFQYYLGTSSGSGALWTDTTNGLQMVVTRNGAEVYRGPLQMPDQLVGQLARGEQDSLTLSVYLPATAGNSLQGLSTTVSYNFTAVTVAGS